MKIISKSDFQDFVNNLINDNSLNVIGVKSRGNKFAFDSLQTAEELRLDYDVTLLPPKKYFFPQRETLFTYDLAGGFSAKKPEEAKPPYSTPFTVHRLYLISLIKISNKISPSLPTVSTFGELGSLFTR